MVNIRKATIEDAKGIATVHVTSWKETYKGIIKDEILSNLDNIERKTEDWKRGIQQNKPNHFIFVAENHLGEIIGFAVGGKNRSEQYDYESELYAIYILSSYKNQGIGNRLLQIITKELFQTAGFNSMLVWVLKDNPSRGFYERYLPQLIDTVYIERLEVEKVVYSWDYIGDILRYK